MSINKSFYSVNIFTNSVPETRSGVSYLHENDFLFEAEKLLGKTLQIASRFMMVILRVIIKIIQ